MTQPYPPQFGQPAQVPAQHAPQAQYAQAPQQYGYPQNQQPPAPQQWAPQPQAYGYPAQQPGYGAVAPQPPQYAPAPAPQAAAMPAPASLDGFYNQPSSGWGPAWQLGNAVQNGTSYIGIVAQWVTKAHLEFATSKNPMTQVEEVRRFKNGDPVVNLKVPLNVVPDQRFTEGRAQFYVGPGEKDLLNAAIAAAGGDPTQPPPLGSMIRATKTGQRGNNFGGQSSTKSVEYWPPEQAQQFAQQLGIPYPDLSTPRPVEEAPKHALPEATGGEGGNFAPAPVSAGPAVQQQAATQPPVGQLPVQQMPPAPAVQAAPPAAPQAPVGPPMGMPPAPVAQLQQAAPAPAPMPGPPPMGSVPNDPAKADLLARLTGQAPQPAA